jgi:hypothetical protein
MSGFYYLELNIILWSPQIKPDLIKDDFLGLKIDRLLGKTGFDNNQGRN